EEVAGTIPGEDAAGPVRAVRGGGQSRDQYASRRIAEAGDGSAPVVVLAESRALRPRPLLAPRDEAPTAPTGGHLILGQVERRGGHGGPGTHANNSRTGCPPSTILIGLSSGPRFSFRGLIFSAWQNVVNRSGTVTGRSLMDVPSALVAPTTRPPRTLAPASA